MLGAEIKKANGELNKFGEPQSDGRLLAIQRAALERGLMVEKGGRDGSVIRFLPPMIISFEQIDFALRVMEEAIIAAGNWFTTRPNTKRRIKSGMEQVFHPDWFRR